MSCITATLISNYEVSPASMLGVLLACARTNVFFLRRLYGITASRFMVIDVP